MNQKKFSYEINFALSSPMLLKFSANVGAYTGAYVLHFAAFFPPTIFPYANVERGNQV